MMNPEELANHLLDLKFVCLDDNTISRLKFKNFCFKDVKTFVESMMKDLDFISFKTNNQFQEFLLKKDYDSFHLLGHLIMVDIIINYIVLNKNCNLSSMIENTLKCAENENKWLINEIFDLEAKRQRWSYLKAMEALTRSPESHLNS